LYFKDFLKMEQIKILDMSDVLKRRLRRTNFFKP